MPTTVAELLKDKPRPITAIPGEPLLDALQRMIEHDYSQLPVVDDNLVPIALLSADSLSRALVAFGVAPDELRVLDAMNDHIKICRGHEDLLEVLDLLRIAGAMIVVDASGKIEGIITSFDTTEYFRRKAQDIMWVQDIEETIKQYVVAAFKDSTGSRDETKLKEAVEAITPSNAKELKGPFRKALVKYLDLAGILERKPDEAHVRAVFDEHILQRDPPKAFEKLSLGQYISLLLHKDRWPKYESIFKLKSDALRRLLVSVLDARNDLAHFRTDITQLQRSQIRQCRDWLNHHEEAVETAFAPPPSQIPDANVLEVGQGVESGGEPENAVLIELPIAKPGLIPQDTAAPASESTSIPVNPAKAPRAESEESRYSPIGAWLQGQPAATSVVTTTFMELDALLDGGLPASAREHRAWWGNITKGHTQSKQWVDNGWIVQNVSMHKEQVTFLRAEHRLATSVYAALTAALNERGIQSDILRGSLWVEKSSTTIDSRLRLFFTLMPGGIRIGALFTRLPPRDVALLDAQLGVADFADSGAKTLGRHLLFSYIKAGGHCYIFADPAVPVTDDGKAITKAAASAADVMVKFRSFIEEHIAPLVADSLPADNV